MVFALNFPIFTQPDYWPVDSITMPFCGWVCAILFTQELAKGYLFNMEKLNILYYWIIKLYKNQFSYSNHSCFFQTILINLDINKQSTCRDKEHWYSAVL